jgi:hypothetical protein
MIFANCRLHKTNIWNPDFMYVHGIFQVYPMYMPSSSISLGYPCISMGGYTWYIHGYPCISMDIHRFLNPDFSAGPCCWSHSMRTQVCVIRVLLAGSSAGHARVPIALHVVRRAHVGNKGTDALHWTKFQNERYKLINQFKLLTNKR